MLVMRCNYEVTGGRCSSKSRVKWLQGFSESWLRQVTQNDLQRALSRKNSHATQTQEKKLSWQVQSTTSAWMRFSRSHDSNCLISSDLLQKSHISRPRAGNVPGRTEEDEYRMKYNHSPTHSEQKNTTVIIDSCWIFLFTVFSNSNSNRSDATTDCGIVHTYNR